MPRIVKGTSPPLRHASPFSILRAVRAWGRLVNHTTVVVTAVLLAACGTPSGSAPDADDGDTQVVDVADLPLEATWHSGVAPLLAEKCGGCHVDGTVAPFSVQTYDDTKAWARAIARSVEARTMPPFDAREDDCATPLPWKHDLRLTDDEIDLLAQWADDGAPEGDPTTARPIPEVETEAIAEPDAVIPIQAPFEVSGDHDIYQCFRIQAPNDEDVWLKAVQVLPDNDKVVHHVLVWSDPQDLSKDRAGDDGTYRCSGTPDFFPTDLVGTWTPGAGPSRAPENTGIPLKAGGTLVVNVHYHPTASGTEVDQTEVALEWTTEQPENHVTWFLVDLPFGGKVMAGPNDPESGPSFRIPPGVSDHRETVVLDTAPYGSYIDLLTLGEGLKIFGVTPHMHYLGTGMKVWIERGDDGAEGAELIGDTAMEDVGGECLVHTPDYRFDWQTTYLYENADTVDYSDLPTVYGGDRIVISCTYDNSESNPFLDDALAAAGIEEPHEVRWGEETGDEMCMAMIGLVIPPVDLGSIFDSLF